MGAVVHGAGGSEPRPERLHCVLVALAAVGAVAALFLLRSVDDNRLTSWRWAFSAVHPLKLYALVSAGVAVAYLGAKLPLPSRRPAAVLFASAYAAGACSWGAPEPIVDASRYFVQAKHLEVYGLGHFLAQWGREIPAWTDLPLVPLLYGLVFQLLGESRTHVQAFTTLLFAGTAVLTWRIGKALWTEEVGFTAGALLLAMPYLLTQVPAMLVDVPTMFFFALAVWAAIEAFQRGGRRRILLASLAVFLAFFSKYSTWLLLSVLPVIGLALARRGAPAPLRTGAAIAAIAGAAVAIALLLGRRVHAEQLALLVGYQAPGLRRWGESFASTFLFQVHPFVTAAALASTALAVKRRDAAWIIVAWPLLLLLALEVRRIRYLVPALPMLALAGAYGLQAIRGAAVRRFAAGCAVASSLVVGLYGFVPFLGRVSAANVQRAGAYLDGLGEASVEVFTATGPGSEVNPAVSVPVLDLFTTKRVIHAYAGAPAEARRAAERSSLRFTWEYRSPSYHAPEAGPEGPDGAAVVIITDDLARPLPPEVERRIEGHRLAAVFAGEDDAFQYRTLVKVYRREKGS